ncbi:MAG: MATE family efflux transporter [Eubacteriales bacterium]|nr:MATE family efflux transporter [Eubacteriales bacterium]
MKKKNQIDMLDGPLLKKMILFAIPILMTSTLQQLFNAIDVAIIGQFAGPQAMAAVGSNGPIINLVVNLLVGMSIGANVVIANYIGQGRRDKVRATVHTTVLIALVGGLFFGLVGVFTALPILNAMHSPPDVIYLATRYLRIYFAGIPLMALYNFCASIMRSKGDTLRPLICLAVGGVVKIGLNLLFVAVFHWDVTGVAVATIIANIISSAMIIRMLTHETDEFRLDIKKLKFHKEQITRIIRIGLPSGIQGMVFSLSNVFIQAAINGFGSEAIAGSSAALNFEYFCYFVLNAFVQTTMTFTGQNYGARNMKRCRKIWRLGMIMGGITTLTFNLGFFAGRAVLIGLFTAVPSVAYWAYIRMQRVLIFQWIANSYEISGASLRGMGHSTLPAVISVFGTCVLRIAWIFTMFQNSGSFEMLMDIYPITWALTGAVTLAAYFIIRHKEEKQ